MKKTFKTLIYPVISIASFLILWELSVRFTKVGLLMPGPILVFKEFIRTFTVPIGKYSIIGHILWSLSRVFIGYLLGAISGVILGVFMGRNKIVHAIFNPFYQMIRPIPPIAWIPLAILWFGLQENSKYFLIFLATFNNVTINAYDGARSVDSELIGVSKMLGANNIQTFFTVILPSSLPQIFAGLQVAISVSWATVVAAEMVRSSEGVGWIIINGQEMNNIVQILVGIVAIGIVGYILATSMRGIERRLGRWNEVGN